MANKRTFKKNLNDMVFDIVEECFYLQMVDDSKTKKTESLIDETAAFQDEVLGKISRSKTKKEFTEMMTIAEMEAYMKKNKHITQVPQVLNISGGVMGVNMKNDGGWKDNLSRIAEAHPTSALADRYRSRSSKEIATRNVVQKHLKRQAKGKK